MWNNGMTWTFHAFPQDGGYYAYFLDTMNPGSWLAVENRIASGLIAYAINYLELNECNIYVRPYKLLSKYPTGKGLGKCSLKNLSSPDLSERETGRGV